MDAALARKRPAGRVYEHCLDGAAEARLIATARGAPPEGRTYWTLRRLAGALARLEVVKPLSYEAARQT